ncbi:hypothetical protein [Mycolicibacterium frederiksbergense]|uniref:hypothetical protein n=1 Tax=Mycolicibacterium frederiksbergense TaxID=117567 RepID=UPI00265BD087|nr:hypothetical protein [Mycolicibacterium frederiksbergense]MBX9922316.1 hypothetical protein [Mycolicibacterium frederiksbergense]MDO0976636.1 hypothetical protein [Mycolicibacterium frederiksbergense]
MKDGGRVLREALVGGQLSEKFTIVEGHVKLGGTVALIHLVELGEDLTVFGDDTGAAGSDARIGFFLPDQEESLTTAIQHAFDLD